MKILSSILSLFLCVTIFASNDRFTDAMSANLDSLKVAESLDQMKACAAKFERIANAEKDQWLAPYYGAFCYTIMSFMEKDDDLKAQYVDKAQAYCDGMAEMEADESEVKAIQAYVYMAKIQLSPMVNGMLYGPKAGSVLDEAIAANPENPRAHYLKGQNLYYTPSMFGGGIDKACPVFKTAAEKFDSYEPATSISPRWGQKYLGKFLKECE